MNREDLIVRSLENLRSTYVAIGGATPKASVESGVGFVLCTCELRHSVGNFAIVRSLPHEDAHRLSAIARTKRSLNVYVEQSPEADDVRRRLREVGFARSFRLSLMGAEGCSSPHAVELREAREPSERLEVAEFMVRQFFFRQPPKLRATIAEATAACGIPLFEARVSQRKVGGVMVSKSPGALGIYNLCVAHTLRGKGYGTDIVRALLSVAASEGVAAVLQCDQVLVRWYRDRGFRELGTIDVFSLERG